MPNPFDVGSCRLAELAGFSAVATTSAGLAATLGRSDMSVSRDELLAHVRELAHATALPLSVDAEQCFPREPGGVSETARQLVDAGASGFSIEDWNSDDGVIEDLGRAAENVALAAAVASEHGLVLTARAENFAMGIDDLEDTITRLCAYRDAGAHAVFAPGLRDVSSVARIVQEVGLPVNVLLSPGGPGREEWEAIGVRRLSVGSSLLRSAYGAMFATAQTLLATGALPADGTYLDRGVADEAFREAR